MAFQKDKPAYYMPLSSESLRNGLVGPSSSVFSSPKVEYSQGTQDFVKLLMKESNLTSSQKQGFQSILRSGSSLPEKPGELAYRKRDFIQRRAAKGKAMGLNLNSSQSELLSVNAFKHLVPGSRRSLDTIKSSGALDPPPPCARNYVPFNQELEKAKLAYRMAYGKYPNHTPVNTPRKGEARRIQKEEKCMSTVVKERFSELIEEVKDRAEFLKAMATIQRDKTYRTYIIFQIKEKIAEMRTLCPLEVSRVLESLHLEEVDPSFADL